MIKVLLTTFLLLFTLNARENPFFPSDGEKDIPYTSIENRELTPLKRATISLPASARVIEKVTISYKNMDGSVETKSIDLENSIDWHLPVFISQSYTSQHYSKPTKRKKFKEIASIKYAKFFSSGKSLKIVTKDKILRNFLLVQPHRIVLDFDRDTSIKSSIKKIPNSIFSKIKVGNHAGYYRVVLELDGFYRYTMKESSDGYLFEVK